MNDPLNHLEVRRSHHHFGIDTTMFRTVTFIGLMLFPISNLWAEKLSSQEPPREEKTKNEASTAMPAKIANRIPSPTIPLDQLFERMDPGRYVRLDQGQLKHHQSRLRAYAPLIEKSRKSTLRVIQKGKQVALATAVTSNGYILTKASELSADHPIKCRDADGQTMKAVIKDQSKLWDLALLKVDQTTHPIKWSNQQPRLGSLLVANDTNSTPYSMGTMSVAPRSLKRGFLGIEMTEAKDGVAIRRVVRDSAAFKAGLKAKDVIRNVEGTDVATIMELRRLIGNQRPGDQIKIQIERDSRRMTIEAELTERPTFMRANIRFGILGMAISKKRTGFPTVIQTDLFVRPDQCGGPVVDLYGNAVGLNIARVDRVSSYAIPSTSIPSILDIDEKESVRFAKPLKTLYEELADAKQKVDAQMAELKASMDRYQDLQSQIKRANERN